MLTLLAAAIVFRADSVRVFAAASLKEAFSEIGRRYEIVRPGRRVLLSFAGSQTLAAQIDHGAPADVFASAAQKNLDQVQYDRGSRRIFATNRLAIVIRPGLRGVNSVGALSSARDIVVADPAVPAGSYTRKFLGKAAKAYGAAWLRQVQSRIVSREADVKAVLAKVRLGEADAGVVYSSDVVSAGGRVGRIDIPDRLNVTMDFPIAVLSSADNPAGAKDFVQYLLSADAQRVLRVKGFTPPPLKPRKAVRP